MFYYPNVLHRHTGCFSTIWLAATRGIRVPLREFLKVNVNRTCLDILDYVTAQVPPPQPSLPRPRFSLYLSSQLQYGVVVVYHRQCALLLEKTQQAVDRLLRSKRCVHIDMAESNRMALDVPDCLHVIEEAEGAQDPFFGLMELNQLPSPHKIHLPSLVITEEEVGSQHSLVPSPNNALDQEGFRSPPAAITLREKEQFSITATEYFEGKELPEATTKEIDLLMDQSDQFLREVEGREMSRELEGAMSSIDQVKETVLRTELDSLWLLGEESDRPLEDPLAALALEITPLQVVMPTPPSEAPEKEVTVLPPRKPGGGRRRQLVFADREVQISDGVMNEQIGNPLAETVNMSQVILDWAPLNKCVSPARLFSTPCGSLLHADLQSLWKQCASLAVLPYQEEQQTSEEGEQDETGRGESEQDREILRTERKRRDSSMKETPSVSGLQITQSSSVLDVILDMGKESGSDVMTPASRWSLQEEVQLPMQSIAEEMIEMPEAQTYVESGDMLSWISSCLQRSEDVSFVSLLPPEADRSTTAHTLYKLLELLSAGHLTALQTHPYSDITICAAAPRVAA